MRSPRMPDAGLFVGRTKGAWISFDMIASGLTLASRPASIGEHNRNNAGPWIAIARANALS